MTARAAARHLVVVPVTTALLMAWPGGLAAEPHVTVPVVPVAATAPLLAPPVPPVPPVPVQVVTPRPAVTAKPARKARPTRRPRPVVTVKPVPRPRVRTARPRPAVVAPARTETVTERGQRLLGSVRYDWRSLGFRVEFRPYTRQYLGLTYPDEKLIVIFVKRTQSDRAILHVLAHEIGHAVDLALNDDRRRRDYLRLRGVDPAREWFPCGGCADYSSPAGDFAEVFEYWLLGGGDFESRLAGPPTRDDLVRMRALFHASPVAADPSPSAVG